MNKRVIVVNAGLAGLTAAYELTRAGTDNWSHFTDVNCWDCARCVPSSVTQSLATDIATEQVDLSHELEEKLCLDFQAN